MLSPLLFGLATQMLRHHNTDSFELVLFADDIFIVARGNESDKPWSVVERRMELLIKDLNQLGLEVNSDKTKVMFLKPRGWKRKRASNHPEFQHIRIAGKALKIGFSMGILGAELTSPVSMMEKKGKD